MRRICGGRVLQPGRAGVSRKQEYNRAPSREGVRLCPREVSRSGRTFIAEGAEHDDECAKEHCVIKIKPRGNETIHQVLKRFKRLCQREGLVREIKRNSYYEKPSERRRRKTRKAARRAQLETMAAQNI